MKSFDDRIREAREKDNQLRERREAESRKKSEQYLARVALGDNWKKITAAMAGKQPDALVASPEGIARAQRVPIVQPSKWQEFWDRHGDWQRASEESWRRSSEKIRRELAIIRNLGLYQPAWDMESLIAYPGKTPEFNHNAWLFLGQDATVYTDLNQSGNIKDSQDIELPYSMPFYPISTCMELGDNETEAISQALATLVVRRNLVIA